MICRKGPKQVKKGFKRTLFMDHYPQIVGQERGSKMVTFLQFYAKTGTGASTSSILCFRATPQFLALCAQIQWWWRVSDPGSSGFKGPEACFDPFWGPFEAKNESISRAFGSKSGQKCSFGSKTVHKMVPKRTQKSGQKTLKKGRSDGWESCQNWFILTSVGV